MSKTHQLQLGGVLPFTAIDYPEKLSAVLFVQGCPWRCSYCHNPHLQTRKRQSALSWDDTLAWLKRRMGLLDGVVFSGGEPTVDPQLERAIQDVRALNFSIGLHSAGTHYRRLKTVLPLIDWIGLDIKAPLNNAKRYDQITQKSGTAVSVIASLDAVIASGKAYEIRTTIHPTWIDEAALLQLGDDLLSRGVKSWALQIARIKETHQAIFNYPSVETINRLKTQFEQILIRHA